MEQFSEFFYLVTHLYSIILLVSVLELVGGNAQNGNVFVVNSDGTSNPICDDDWDELDARVVCKQLGFDNGNATHSSKFGNVPDTFVMDDVKCSGNENNIMSCDHTKDDNCGTLEGAGVICFNEIRDFRDIGLCIYFYSIKFFFLINFLASACRRNWKNEVHEGECICNQ